MYRIELKPGEENVFRTIEELATGIRNGLVTPRARIFHNASQKWLPIEFHPHYKKALSMPPTKSGETPAVGAKSSKSPETHGHAAKPAKVAQMPSAAAAPAPAPFARTRELTFIPTDPPKPAPEAVAAPAPAPARDLPPAAIMSPVVALPAITYKEPARPAETAPHARAAHQSETVRHHHDPVVHGDVSLPVAHQPLTRTEVRRIKPAYLGGLAAALIVGSYVALSAATPSTKTEATVEESAKPEVVEASATPPPLGSSPAVDSVPAPRTPTATASTTGPTFGGLPAPAPAKPPIVTSAGASPAATAGKDTSVTIEPAPAAVDLSVPSLPSGDSLAPTLSDTGAMRRILRAVGGKGASPSRP